MAKDGLFSKALVTIIVTLWVGLVGFNWAAHYVLKYGMPTFALGAPEAEPAPVQFVFLGPPVPEPFVGPPAPVKPVAKKADEKPTAEKPAVEKPKPESPKPVEKPVLALGPAYFPLPTEPEPAEPAPTEPEPAEPEPAESLETAAQEPPDDSESTESTQEPTPAAPARETPPGQPVADQAETKQYGAFANPNNAERLAEELKAGGREITIEPVQTDQGTLYRVREEAPAAPPPPDEPPVQAAPEEPPTPSATEEPLLQETLPAEEPVL